MSDREERMRKLRGLAKESKEEADELLERELEALKSASQTDLEKLRPHGTDEASYRKLIAAVQEATQRNENLAEFKDRLQKLGSEVLHIAKKAADLLSHV